MWGVFQLTIRAITIITGFQISQKKRRGEAVLRLEERDQLVTLITEMHSTRSEAEEVSTRTIHVRHSVFAVVRSFIPSNQTSEPTIMSVTIPAAQEVAPAMIAAHL